ncbi:hypothetical protein OG417_54125 [Actinoallomurus sp. NBC_01490]|jgi:ABC-2 type transport system ATP-binding protein|uniref:hypothetical protein n=1 Tax=Actinoallomurus sp. NBC_01490 TaxID=2903557 RepID=UPI002E328D51|nr:hypothetical protein [Actinoallomurus sp. NBC_01490]
MCTATENLLLAGRVHGMSRRDPMARARELVDRFGLADAANRLVRTYSGGMARPGTAHAGTAGRSGALWVEARYCTVAQ